MIQASTPTLATRETALPTRRVRIRSSAFWLLLICESVLLLVVFLAILRVAPSHTPLSATKDVMQVREAVLQRLSGQESDALVPHGAAGTAYESNVRGYELRGQTYYYSVSGLRTADPLGRGAIAGTDAEIVLREPFGDQEILIYRILR